MAGTVPVLVLEPDTTFRSRLSPVVPLLVLSTLAATAQVGASAGLPGDGKFFAGGGYMIPLDRSAALYFTALYNFSAEGEDNPYGDAFDFGAGVSFGF